MEREARFKHFDPNRTKSKRWSSRDWENRKELLSEIRREFGVHAVSVTYDRLRNSQFNPSVNQIRTQFDKWDAEKTHSKSPAEYPHLPSKASDVAQQSEGLHRAKHRDKSSRNACKRTRLASCNSAVSQESYSTNVHPFIDSDALVQLQSDLPVARIRGVGQVSGEPILGNLQDRVFLSSAAKPACILDDSSTGSLLYSVCFKYTDMRGHRRSVEVGEHQESNRELAQAFLGIVLTQTKTQTTCDVNTSSSSYCLSTLGISGNAQDCHVTDRDHLDIRLIADQSAATNSASQHSTDHQRSSIPDHSYVRGYPCQPTVKSCGDIVLNSPLQDLWFSSSALDVALAAGGISLSSLRFTELLDFTPGKSRQTKDLDHLETTADILCGIYRWTEAFTLYLFVYTMRCRDQSHVTRRLLLKCCRAATSGNELAWSLALLQTQIDHLQRIERHHTTLFTMLLTKSIMCVRWDQEHTLDESSYSHERRFVPSSALRDNIYNHGKQETQLFKLYVDLTQHLPLQAHDQFSFLDAGTIMEAYRYQSLGLLSLLPYNQPAIYEQTQRMEKIYLDELRTHFQPAKGLWKTMPGGPRASESAFPMQKKGLLIVLSSIEDAIAMLDLAKIKEFRNAVLRLYPALDIDSDSQSLFDRAWIFWILLRTKHHPASTSTFALLASILGMSLTEMFLVLADFVSHNRSCLETYNQPEGSLGNDSQSQLFQVAASPSDDSDTRSVKKLDLVDVERINRNIQEICALEEDVIFQTILECSQTFNSRGATSFKIHSASRHIELLVSMALLHLDELDINELTSSWPSEEIILRKQDSRSELGVEPQWLQSSDDPVNSEILSSIGTYSRTSANPWDSGVGSWYGSRKRSSSVARSLRSDVSFTTNLSSRSYEEFTQQQINIGKYQGQSGIVDA